MSENRASLRRAGLELLALITVAWLINISIEPDPPGVSVIRFSLKWFIYTYVMAAIVFVLTPFLSVMLLGSVLFRVVLRKSTYWQVYRFAFIVATMWTVLGNYGLWYGKSHQSRSISSILSAVATETISNESSFVMLSLPFDVAIDIPRDWLVLNDAINQLIRTSRDAALDLRGISTSDDEETVLIAANSRPPTYAALRVARVQPPLAVPADVVGLTNSELIEMKREFETEMRQLLRLQGLTFLEATGIEIEEVGGWPALVFSYRRAGPRGPVFVELIQVVRRADLLQINLSYRENEQVLWMPVIRRITQSIRAR